MNEEAPLISVCVANFNGRAVIDACLQSVLKQQGSVSFEILVHDDASTDGYLEEICRNYPQVRMLASDANVGFCVANNRMAAVARGKYLLLLNNDASLFPDALQSLAGEAQRLQCPAILSLPQYDAQTDELVDRGCLLDPFFNPVPNRDVQRQNVAMVIGACLWIPTSLWARLGGFPAWFGSIAEDLYLCGRARLNGYPVRVLDHSGYRHWQGRSFGGNKIAEGRLSTTFRRRALSERNKTFALGILTPAPLVYGLLPLHLGVLMVEGGALAVLRRDLSIWRRIYAPALLAVWQSRDLWLALRKSSQAYRTLGMSAWLSGFTGAPYKIVMLRKHGMPRID